MGLGGGVFPEEEPLPFDPPELDPLLLDPLPLDPLPPPVVEEPPEPGIFTTFWQEDVSAPTVTSAKITRLFSTKMGSLFV